MHTTPTAPCLIVLCGTPASGKSTYAATHYRASEIVSLDACSEMVGDGDLACRDQAHALFWTTIDLRCQLQRRTVVDRTCLTPTTRAKLLDVGRSHHLPVHCVVFDVPWETLQARDQARAHPHDPAILRRCWEKAQQALVDIPGEGFDGYEIVGCPC